MAKAMRAAICLLVVGLVGGIATAVPNAQFGLQTGSYWSESTRIAVQGGTRYELNGAMGDHDIVFLDANGNMLRADIACGPDEGTVPATAVAADVLIWDHWGQVSACDDLPGHVGSVWIYVDGM